MTDPQHIYLDNAATSFPKPESVYDAVDHYQRELGAAVGRGSSKKSLDVQRAVDRCRQQAAGLLGATSPKQILFTFNGTDSLNIALHGLLESGDHVVASQLEHNSVLRPLRELEKRIGIDVTIVQADSEGRIAPEDVRVAIRSETRLVTLIHASNVIGTIQPINDIGQIVRESGALFLVDAAQSAGHLPIDVANSPIDLLACPGHKGLLGPLGTGLLFIRPGLEEQIRSFRQGGTGSVSEEEHQPHTMPDKLESGNHNAPGLIGLEVGLDWIVDCGIDSLREHEMQLTTRLLDGLLQLDGLQVYGTRSAEESVGVVSVSLPDFEPQVLAALLEDNFAIQTRAGLHCAPGAHCCLDTFSSGGTVRFSPGPFTREEEIDAAVFAMSELMRELK